MLWIYGGHAGHAIRANTEISLNLPTAPTAAASDVIEPEGHFDDVAVLPFQETDYVSRELRNEARG